MYIYTNLLPLEDQEEVNNYVMRGAYVYICIRDRGSRTRQSAHAHRNKGRESGSLMERDIRDGSGSGWPDRLQLGHTL